MGLGFLYFFILKQPNDINDNGDKYGYGGGDVNTSII